MSTPRSTSSTGDMVKTNIFSQSGRCHFSMTYPGKLENASWRLGCQKAVRHVNISAKHVPGCEDAVKKTLRFVFPGIRFALKNIGTLTVRREACPPGES